MNLTSRLLNVVNRDTVAGWTIGSVVLSGIAVMFAAGPAFGVTCSLRDGWVEQGSSGSSPVVRAVAHNRCGSNNQHTLRVRLRMNDTLGRDETISQADYAINTAVSSDYTRSVQGCRGGSHTYHEDQFLNGGQEKRSPGSSDRTFNFC
jgi:hypothetical protein